MLLMLYIGAVQVHSCVGVIKMYLEVFHELNAVANDQLLVIDV